MSATEDEAAAKEAAAVKIQKVHRGKKSSAKQRLITVLMDNDDSLGTPQDRIDLTELSMKELKEKARDAGVSKKEIQKAVSKSAAAKERLMKSKKAQELKEEMYEAMVNDASMFMENKQKAIQICTEGGRQPGSLPKNATSLSTKKKKQLYNELMPLSVKHIKEKGKRGFDTGRYGKLDKEALSDLQDLPDHQGVYVEKDRDCTDCWCCLVFLAYWLGMCYLIFFAVEYGEIQRLIRPRDMWGNSCGLENIDADLTAYPQLYLPNPADETVQICTAGCPGSSTGTCSGESGLSYHTLVDNDASAAWARTRRAKTAIGADVETPEDGTLPWYTSEPECVLGGDCIDVDSNAAIFRDVPVHQCVAYGKCTNTTSGEQVDPPGQQQHWLASQQLSCEGTSGSQTGCVFTHFEWTPYKWSFDESAGDLFVCRPKEGCDDPACAHPDYPPDPEDFLTASSNRWLSQDGPCWMPVFESQEYLYRCVPTLLTDQVSEGQAEGQASVQYMKDLQDYWRVIPFGATLALVTAFAWIIFLGKFAYYLIIGTCVGVEIILPIISGVCFYKLGAVPTRTCVARSATAAAKTVAACLAADISANPQDMDFTGEALENCAAVGKPVGTDEAEDLQGDCVYTPGLYFEIPPEVQQAMDEANTSDEYTLYIAYGSLVAWVVLGIIFCVFKQRILISIGVIEEASDAFLDIPFAVFLPLVVLMASLPVSAFCCFACFLLLSLRRLMEDGSLALCLPDDPSIPLSDLEMQRNADCNAPPSILQAMFFAQIFGWLWTVQWFLSIQYTGVAGAISNWYFTKENEETNEKKISPVMLSFSMFRTVRFHSGTMALGSFVISVVIVIKFAALYVVNQLQAQATENKAVQFALKVLKVVILCVEKFIRFMGHLAYIEVAIWGKTFCGGLLTAVKLLAKNVVRFSFVTLFSKLVLILGKILIVVSAVAVSYTLLPFLKTGAITVETVDGVMQVETPPMPGSEDAIPVLPLFLVAFFSLTISINIMGIYETAIDTIMVSFLEDEMENDGGIFGSGPLKSFMKGTKSVSAAAERYAEAMMAAKNEKVRSKYEMEAELKNSDLTPGGGHDALKKKRKDQRRRKNKNDKQKKASMSKEERKAHKKKKIQSITESEGKGLN